MIEDLILATTMTVAIGVAAGYLGTLMLSKRMSLVGGPLGHLTLPGITLALLYGFDVSLGALGVLLAAIVLIWLLEKRTKLPWETLTAVVFASSVALAFLWLPQKEMEIALIGDISRISVWQVAVSMLLAGGVVLGVSRIYRNVVLAAISEDLAKAEGVKVERDNLLYLLAVAIVIGLGVRVVGGLLTAAIVAIPAATSRNLSRNMRQYAWGGAIAGGLAGVLGMSAYYWWGIPAGPAVILASAVLFLLSVAGKGGRSS